MSMKLIEGLIKEYAEQRRILTNRVDILETEMRRLKRLKLPGIKSAVDNAAESESKLRAALENNKDLFVKPKSIVFDGVKVGFKKEKGKIKWEDPALVIRLIKKHYSDQVELLIHTEEKPNKDGLNKLSVAELKKVGVTLTKTTDEVLVKATDSEVDKIVTALLKDALKEEKQSAA